MVYTDSSNMEYIFRDAGNKETDSIHITVTEPATSGFESESDSETDERSSIVPGFTISLLIVVGLFFTIVSHNRKRKRENEEI